MRHEQEPRLSPRMQRAVTELEELVKERYPEATFQVRRSSEDPRTIHLLPTVDVEDRDEVMDVIVDRMLELQIQDKLPLFVVPLRTPEREAQVRAQLQRQPHRAANVPVDISTSQHKISF